MLGYLGSQDTVFHQWKHHLTSFGKNGLCVSVSSTGSYSASGLRSLEQVVLKRV